MQFNTRLLVIDTSRTELQLWSGSMRTSTPELRDRSLVGSKYNPTRCILTIFSLSGFDEYMNLVLDNATECHMKRGTRKQLGRIMLKGDSITLIQTKDEK